MFPLFASLYCTVLLNVLPLDTSSSEHRYDGFDSRTSSVIAALDAENLRVRKIRLHHPL